MNAKALHPVKVYQAYSDKPHADDPLGRSQHEHRDRERKRGGRETPVQTVNAIECVSPTGLTVLLYVRIDFAKNRMPRFPSIQQDAVC
jgi:hypothetical protein